MTMHSGAAVTSGAVATATNGIFAAFQAIMENGDANEWATRICAVLSLRILC